MCESSDLILHSLWQEWFKEPYFWGLLIWRFPRVPIAAWTTNREDNPLHKSFVWRFPPRLETHLRAPAGSAGAGTRPVTASAPAGERRPPPTARRMVPPAAVPGHVRGPARPRRLPPRPLRARLGRPSHPHPVLRPPPEQKGWGKSNPPLNKTLESEGRAVSVVNILWFFQKSSRRLSCWCQLTLRSRPLQKGTAASPAWTPAAAQGCLIFRVKFAGILHLLHAGYCTVSIGSFWLSFVRFCRDLLIISF